MEALIDPNFGAVLSSPLLASPLLNIGWVEASDCLSFFFPLSEGVLLVPNENFGALCFVVLIDRSADFFSSIAEATFALPNEKPLIGAADALALSSVGAEVLLPKEKPDPLVPLVGGSEVEGVESNLNPPLLLVDAAVVPEAAANTNPEPLVEEDAVDELNLNPPEEVEESPAAFLVAGAPKVNPEIPFEAPGEAGFWELDSAPVYPGRGVSQELHFVSLSEFLT